MQNTMRRAITIQGTHCPSCKSLIEEVSQDIPGVVSTNVDFKTGQTVIEYDQRLDWNRLKQEIENLGEYQVIVHPSQDFVATADSTPGVEEAPMPMKALGLKGMWMMALCCGLPILAVVGISALGYSSQALNSLAALGCPLMMVAMMVMMRGKGGAEDSQNAHACCPPEMERKTKPSKPAEVVHPTQTEASSRGQVPSQAQSSLKAVKERVR